MRKLLLASLTGATLIGGALIAQTASAQPYVVYPSGEPGYRFDDYGRPYYDDGYRGPGLYAGEAAVPYDRFGPDPNGMIAPDGHRIKCKLDNTYSPRFDRYVTRRICD
jgi:hypothetical protein